MGLVVIKSRVMASEVPFSEPAVSIGAGYEQIGSFILGNPYQPLRTGVFAQQHHFGAALDADVVTPQVMRDISNPAQPVEQCLQVHQGGRGQAAGRVGSGTAVTGSSLPLPIPASA